MPTPSIFDFDAERLDDYDADRTAQALETEPAIYVNHLQIAQNISDAAVEREQFALDAGTEADRRFDEGYAAGLRAVAARLRQADFTSAGKALKHDGGRFKAR
ncbi:MAG: hypothetical protein ACRDOY_14210 [Nocardioidaceae bacterium]